MITRSVSAAAGVALVVAALTACASPAPPASSPSPTTTAPAPQSSPTPTASPEPTPDAALSCESMISNGTVEALTEAGWSAKPKDFVIGDVDLTDSGMLCFWADYSVGSDHGQLYGWAEITTEDAVSAQAALLASGWTREDAPEGTYITEDPQFSMGTDDDGYGMTYLFHDGWVKLADTRQGLVLIDWAG